MESENSTPAELTAPAVATAPIQHKRIPDDQFLEEYANNVVFESSAWDLRLIFGKLDQSKEANPNTVMQFGAITLPWPQIKAGIYFLQIHLAAQELLNGKVYVPKGVIPPPVPPTPDQEKSVPHAREVFELATELFKRFSESNPESF